MRRLLLVADSPLHGTVGGQAGRLGRAAFSEPTGASLSEAIFDFAECQACSKACWSEAAKLDWRFGTSGQKHPQGRSCRVLLHDDVLVRRFSAGARAWVNQLSLPAVTFVDSSRRWRTQQSAVLSTSSRTGFDPATRPCDTSGLWRAVPLGAARRAGTSAMPGPCWLRGRAELQQDGGLQRSWCCGRNSGRPHVLSCWKRAFPYRQARTAAALFPFPRLRWGPEFRARRSRDLTTTAWSPGSSLTGPPCVAAAGRRLNRFTYRWNRIGGSAGETPGAGGQVRTQSATPQALALALATARSPPQAGQAGLTSAGLAPARNQRLHRPLDQEGPG